VGADDDKEEPEGERPEITSFSPQTVSAGVKKSYNENTGAVTYVSHGLVITIKGKNLEGATLSANNVGTDNKPGIKFKNIESNAAGTKVQGYLVSHPTAKDGKTVITLTNKHGQSTMFELEVTITGTQYLKRVFSREKVKFFGERIEVMPNQSILDLENQIRGALNVLTKPTYKKLGVISHIYEISHWETTAENKYCGDSKERGFSAGGCAAWNDNIIHVSEESHTKEILIHESAHKLHFYYLGLYSVKSPPNSFEIEWKQQLGNLAACQYLPLKPGDNVAFTWSDGTASSRCGFVQPYGAYLADKGIVYEDVATFAQQSASPQSGDTSDPRYKNKMNLIKKYGF
jgi:hypothetical protein